MLAGILLALDLSGVVLDQEKTEFLHAIAARPVRILHAGGRSAFASDDVFLSVAVLGRTGSSLFVVRMECGAGKTPTFEFDRAIDRQAIAGLGNFRESYECPAVELI